MKRFSAIRFFSLLLPAVVLLSARGLGQELPAVPNAHAYSSPDGVAVMFGSFTLLHPALPAGPEGWIGYNIYRKGEGEASFRKVNDAPVSRGATLAEAERRFAHVLDLAALAMKKSSREEVWKLFESNDRNAIRMAIFNNDLQEVLGLLFRDRDVRNGVRYEYYAVFVSPGGKESARSETRTVVYGRPDFALLGPKEIHVQEGSGEVELTWKTNPDDHGAFSYRVYRAVDSASLYQQINLRPIVLISDGGAEKPREGSFKDSGLIDGHTYWYTVVSCDLVGNESRRTLVKATPHDAIPPQLPGPLAAHSASLGILISWGGTAESDVAGYDIYRSVHPDSAFAQINDAVIPAADTTYEDRKAAPNRQYYYRIVAVDESGNRSEESAYCIGYYSNVRPPLPPQYVKAVGNDQGVRIEWERNDEEDLQGYYIFRAESLDGELVQISPLIGSDTTFFQDTSKGLSSKGTYWYLAQAINLSGAVSRFSIPTAARPELKEPPMAPMTFHGYAENYGNRVFWSGLTDNTISGINIYRASAGDAEPRWQRLNREPLATVPGQFTDSSAAKGVEYIYHIRSVNEFGLESDPTQTLSLKRHTPSLLPPDNLMVTRAERGVALQWDAPFDSRVKGYAVYRKTGKEKEEKISRGLIAGTSFVDPTAADGTIYFYSVAAIAEDGTESQGRTQMLFEGR